MRGETPMTGALVSRTASAMPGTCRMVPIDTTGLDGAMTTQSASVSNERSANAASSAPSNSTRDTATECRMPTKYSWNDTILPSAARWTRVETRPSDMGTMRTRTPNARRISSVTSVRLAPSTSRDVR